MPVSISLIILIGDSLRGLSEVIMVKSARFDAIAPILGLFFLSRSPPHPKSIMSLPYVCGFKALNIFSIADGVCAKSTKILSTTRSILPLILCTFSIPVMIASVLISIATPVANAASIL